MSYSGDLYEFASLNKTLTSIQIELNSSCNWRCKHCYIDDFNNQSKLSLSVLDKLFIDLRELGVVDMLFTGGEIFLRDDIIDVLKLARSYFFNVSLFTNVSLLDENLIKSLKDLYIDNISCTLFSMNPEIHDNISQSKGSLLKTLKNLDILKKYNMSVQVKHIITKLNQFEYKEIADYCTEMGFNFLATTSIFPKRDKDRSPLNLKVDEDYLDKNLANIDYYRGYSSQEKNTELYVCNATRYSLSILANGDILPCNNLYKAIGNILDDDIKKVWKNSEYLNWVQSLQWKDLKQCNSCESSKYCIRCGGIALLESSNLLAWNLLKKVSFNISNKISCEGGRNKHGKVHKTNC